MSVKRTTRLLKLLITLQSESKNSTKGLLETLRVGRRTLYRDLCTLQEAGVPCYFNRSANRYMIDGSFYMLPPNLTLKEAFSLLLLAYKAQEVLDIPFGHAALHGALKIENALPPKIKRQCSKKLKTVSIHGKPMKSKASIDGKFELLQQAICRRWILKLAYDSESEHGVVISRFSPLHLVYNDSWYIMGKLNCDRQIKSISLRNIRHMERTGKCFLDEEKFDPSSHLARAWGTIPEGKLYNVRLRFEPEIADKITAIKWHSSQHTTVQEDGSVIIEFRVDGLSEITWWIVGFADKVEVLAPASLRKRIHKIAENMAQQNKTDDIKTTLHKELSRYVTV